MTRALGTLLPLAVAASWYHLFAPTTAWTTSVHWIISALIAGGALLTAVAAWRARPGLHVAIATSLLGAQAVIIATSLAGLQLVDFNLFPDRRLAVVIGGALLVAIYGLVRGRMWGRGLGMALGAVGALSGGLNTTHFWSVSGAVDPTYVDWSMTMFLTAWVMLVSTLGGAMIVINLVAPSVREAFAARTRDAAWTSDHRVLRGTRALVITAFAAVPMLLVYAWVQPIVPATQTSALCLAIALTIGGVLAVRGKLLGALLLVLAGAGLLVQTALSARGANNPEDLQIVGYYAVFWVPAGIVALVSGGRLAGPTWRLLRS